MDRGGRAPTLLVTHPCCLLLIPPLQHTQSTTAMTQAGSTIQLNELQQVKPGENGAGHLSLHKKQTVKSDSKAAS